MTRDGAEDNGEARTASRVCGNSLTKRITTPPPTSSNDRRRHVPGATRRNAG